MKQLLLSIVGALFFATSAWAGPQYVDASGYAVSGYDVVAYHDLPMSAVGEPQAQAVPGKKSITAEYNGATWAFSTEANREKFLADPEKYVPAFDGHCAYGIAKGGKVPANPHLWRIVDGKLYLNITKTVVGFWESDIAGNISVANANWAGGLGAKSASTRPIPEYTAGPVPN